MISKRNAFLGAVLLVILTVMITVTVGNIRALQVGDKVIISQRMFKIYRTTQTACTN
jgi:carboxyl-terminal processing protease